MRVKILLIAAGILLLVAASLPAKSTLFTLIYDMFNQISIKPQEQGGMSEFVIGAVSIDGEKVADDREISGPGEFVLKVGKRRFLKVSLQ